ALLLHQLGGVQALPRFPQQIGLLGLHSLTPSLRTLIIRGLSSRSNRSAEMKAEEITTLFSSERAAVMSPARLISSPGRTGPASTTSTSISEPGSASPRA